MPYGIDPGSREVIGDAEVGGLREAASLWLLDHRRQVRRAARIGLVPVLVVAAALGVAVGAHQLSGPDLPRLVDARPMLSTIDLVAPRWRAGDDGRPASPVIVGVRAVVTLRGLPSGQRAGGQLLGIAGPGLLPLSADPVDTSGRPVAVPGDGAPADVLWDLPVSCDAVPLPVPARAYRLQVRVTGSDGRRRTGEVAAGGLGDGFARAVQAGCGSWLARRDVTVTRAAVAVDPHEPRAAVTLSVTNRGSRPVRLVAPAGNGLGVDFHLPGTAGGDPREVSVPARATTAVTATLVVEDCAEALTPAASGAGSGTPTTLSMLGLAGVVGPGTAQGGRPGDGTGPDGVLISEDAAGELRGARAALCPLGLQFTTAQFGVDTRWDAARRVLSLPVRVDVPDLTGQGASVTGAELAGGPLGDPNGITLVTPPGTAFAVAPGGSGLSLTLTYRIPARISCSTDGTPQLPAPLVRLHVVTSGTTSGTASGATSGAAPNGVRTVPVQLSLFGPWPPPGSSGWLTACT